MSSLERRLSALEVAVPAPACRTCAARPAFTVGGSVDACRQCGREPLTFTISIDRAGTRPDDAA
jgi:hypothetical protein